VDKNGFKLCVAVKDSEHTLSFYILSFICAHKKSQLTDGYAD